jgi:trans-aconitate methyltransferase
MNTSKKEFDAIAKDYNDEIVENLGVFGKFRNSMLSYKAEYLSYIMPSFPSKKQNRYPQSILDYGCGVGMNIPYLRQYFPDSPLFGCDVSKESIRLAKSQIDYCQFDVIETPRDLKIYEGKIDCVFISTVLHHIKPGEHKIWLKALCDTMKEGSYMVIFEHNILNPLTKRLVEKSEMDRDAIMLSARYCKTMIQEIFCSRKAVKLRYAYFFPWRNKVFTAIEHKLSWLPLGAQYYVAVKKFF